MPGWVSVLAALATGVLIGLSIRSARADEGKRSAAAKAEQEATEQAERDEAARAGKAAQQAEAAKAAATPSPAAPTVTPNAEEKSEEQAPSSPATEAESKPAGEHASRRKKRLAVTTNASSFGARVVLRADQATEGGDGTWQKNHRSG